MHIRGFDDNSARHWSERHWTDANGAVCGNTAFTNSRYAGSRWLDQRDEPNDFSQEEAPSPARG